MKKHHGSKAKFGAIEPKESGVKKAGVKRPSFNSAPSRNKKRSAHKRG